MRYPVAMALRIPAVLASTVLGVVGATAAGVAAMSCHGTYAPPPDAMVCSVHCIPTGAGSNACTPPTCPTGPNHDVCPMGCAPEPIA